MTARRTKPAPRTKKTSKRATASSASTRKKAVKKAASTREKAVRTKKAAAKKTRKKPVAKKPAGATPARKPKLGKSAAKTAKPRAAGGKARASAKARPARPRKSNSRTLRIAATRSREIGAIRHAYKHASAAILELSGELRVGDWIAVRGATTDFTQQVESLRLDDHAVASASAGDTVGIATLDATRVGDRVERLDP